MKALTYHGPRDVRYESFEDPKLHSARDAIVKVEKCGICGSDLHIYHGEGFTEETGFCIGHEAMGEVVEIGKEGSRLKVGDKVIVSAAVGCGACRSCIGGDVINCETNASNCYGLTPALQGSQAEAVRVPAADYNAALLPEGVSAEQGLMMTDGLATAWFGARKADIRRGGTVAVIGLGPIGLMAVEAAFVMGAARVFAIDLVEERRAIARELGAETPDADSAPEVVRELTKGRMCESVVEAVGHSATIKAALRLVARRGTVSVIGVNQDPNFAFPMHKAFYQGLNFTIGTCSVPEEWPALTPLIQAGRLKPERYISHRLPLSEGAAAYEMFDKKQDGAMKVIFDLA